MDIQELKPTDRIVEILHPKTEQELGIRVSLMSVSDERLQKLKRKFQDERMRMESRGKHFKAENLDQNLDDLCVAAVLDWEWGVSPITGKPATFHGEKPEFNRANLLKIFKELPWFRDQIQKEIGDEQSFFPV